MKNPSVYSEPLVKEFYANIVLNDGYMERKALVRNHFVIYDVVYIQHVGINSEVEKRPTIWL